MSKIDTSNLFRSFAATRMNLFDKVYVENRGNASRTIKFSHEDVATLMAPVRHLWNLPDNIQFMMYVIKDDPYLWRGEVRLHLVDFKSDTRYMVDRWDFDSAQGFTQSMFIVDLDIAKWFFTPHPVRAFYFSTGRYIQDTFTMKDGRTEERYLYSRTSTERLLPVTLGLLTLGLESWGVRASKVTHYNNQFRIETRQPLAFLKEIKQALLGCRLQLQDDPVRQVRSIVAAETGHLRRAHRDEGTSVSHIATHMLFEVENATMQCSDLLSRMARVPHIPPSEVRVPISTITVLDL